MKERPILFNCDMVRAILNGRKTQTRRMVKHIPDLGGPDSWCHKANDKAFAEIVGAYARYCPFGSVGDRLWVRETWRGVVKISGPNEYYETGVARYIPNQSDCIRVEYASSQKKDLDPWRPSIHMPRWASRITLEITSVRVERLQKIDDRSAGQEGVMYYKYSGKYCDSAKLIFKQLWNSIYKNWDENPWVWVVEFKVVTK